MVQLEYRYSRSNLLMEEKKMSSMLVNIAKEAPGSATDSISIVTILEGGSSIINCREM